MDLANQTVVIAGLGRSALGATALLRDRGASVFISDAGESPAIAAWAAQAETLGAVCEMGGHSTDRFLAAGCIVMSPGVPPGIAPVAAARAAGVPVIAELELAARCCTAPLIAVTGTNGKTTVTELLAAMMRACGHTVALAGNNKTAFSQAVLTQPDADWIVLEVSSYQLETVDRFHPRIGVALNLGPDHLGRHGTMEGYAAAKARLFMNQQPGDLAVLNADDSAVMALPTPAGVTRQLFSCSRAQDTGIWTDGTTIFNGSAALAPVSDCPLPGRHNLANAVAALSAAYAAGLDLTACLDALRAFHGVEHRIEYVATRDGVRYFNDSKATNLDSLRVALESFQEPVVLIAGGQGKGAPYDGLRGLVRRRVKHMVALGEDALKLLACFGDEVTSERAESMAGAVQRARAAAEAGDVVLLSPGCASFDMYANFEERGLDFKQCVKRVADTAPITASTGEPA